MSLGKKRYMVEAGTFVSLTELFTELNPVTDRIRQVTGKFWVELGDDLLYGSGDVILDYSIPDQSFDDTTLTYSDTVSFNVADIETYLGQTFSIDTGWDSKDAAQVLLNALMPGSGLVVGDATGGGTDIDPATQLATAADPYRDHYIEYFSPFNSFEQSRLDQNTMVTNGNIDFAYNFYDGNSEPKNNVLTVSQFSRSRTNFDAYTGINRKNKRFKGGTTILSPKTLDSLQDISLNKRNLAMYADISFDTDGFSAMADKIESTNFTTAAIIKSIEFSRQHGSTSSFMSAEAIVADDGTAGIRVSEKSMGYIDYQTFAKNLDLSAITIPSKVQIYDLDDTEKGYSNLNHMDLCAFFAKVVINGQLQNTIQDNLRSYKDILNGTPCHSETLYYEISKYENGTLLERFFVPNSVDLSINNIIDMHVRYDKVYQYVVNAYKLIVGSKYYYSDADATLGQDYAEGGGSETVWSKLKVTITTEPSIVLMRVPYFIYDGQMIDLPSIAPDVNPIPYMGIDNRILLLLNQSIGNYEKQPTSLNRLEERTYAKYRRRANQRPNSDIEFNTDDPPVSFLVYRIEHKPRSYSDFDGNIRHTVFTKYSTEEPNYSFNASIVDKVLPNKKYYYLFRSTDIHKNISDISEIYEMQIINDNGAIYLLTSIVELERQKDHIQPTISFRNLLRIKPALQQVAYNTEIAGLYESATAINSVKPLSISNDTVWDNQFKIRITSKKTGRKIDLNTSFTQQYQKRKVVEEARAPDVPGMPVYVDDTSPSNGDDSGMGQGDPEMPDVDPTNPSDTGMPGW